MITPNAFALVMLVLVLLVLPVLKYFLDYINNIAVFWFVGAISSSIIWTLIQSMNILISNKVVSEYLLIFTRFFGLISSLCLFFFIFEYTLGKKLNKKIISVFLIIPVITSTVLFINTEAFMLYDYDNTVIDWIPQEFGIIHISYVLGLHLLGFGMLILEYIRCSGNKRMQILILGIIYSIVVPSIFLPVLDIVPNYINPTIFAVLFGIIIAGYALKRYGLFTDNIVDSQEIINTIKEPVFILNSENTIVRVNRSSKELFEKDLLGEKISDFVDIEKNKLTIATQSYIISKTEIEYGRKMKGKVIIFNDVTKLKNREEDLEVLRKVFSRLFRHNIRNELTVIQGHNDNISRKIEESKVENDINAVRKSSDRLLDHIEKAQEMSTIISESNTEGHGETIFNPGEVMNKVISNFRKDSIINEEQIVIEDMIDKKIIAHRLLPEAIIEATKNSIKHNDKNVNVRISCKRQKSNAVFVITDDGRGISETEIDVMNSEEITSLHHSSGVGLWYIKTIVQQSNGELSIKNLDGGGTQLKITVPIYES